MYTLYVLYIYLNIYTLKETGKTGTYIYIRQMFIFIIPIEISKFA